MPKVSDAHLEARRKQILDASSACFARQGFHQTTMQDIRPEAALSPGAVYRYFASKEEITAASCQDCHQQSRTYRLWRTLPSRAKTHSRSWTCWSIPVLVGWEATKLRTTFA